MSLSSGSRLGSYEILAPLGAGGMGEVYRARDTRLKREVAVKLLSDELSRDAEHLSRFQREAEMLAAVNHPSIAAIYGIEEFDGVRFLVLELVPGETLAERLTPGRLPIEEALDIGRQIAEALDSAHERGIVHRDLKPGNVKITPEGRVKVLDFGLAKSLESTGADSVAATVGVTSTQVGTVLGTPAYMSPEQARGQTLDERTDVWSFGCVLYETLTGKEAFAGDTFSDRLAAILREEPDWDALPRDTPPVVARLLARCLEKNPNRRLRDVGEARSVLEEALADLREGSPRTKSRRSVGASILQSFRAAFVRTGAPPTPAPIAPPRLSQLTFAKEIEAFPAFSPDGTEVAFAREVGPVRKLFVKPLASGEERPLTEGPSDDIQPAWSPDGKTVLFVRARADGRRLEPRDVYGQYDGGDLWAIDVATRRETILLENAFHPAFSPDGSRIAVDASWAGPRRLWTLDARGRNPEQASTDFSEAVAHLRPRWSPDSSRIVFQNVERTRFGIRVLELSSKKTAWIADEPYPSMDPCWSHSGRFVYFSSYRGGGINLWRVPVSDDGVPAAPPQQLTTGAGQDVQAELSRDARRLVFATLRQNADLWRLPVSPDTGRPTGPPEEVIATTREDSRGAWSPDGRRIAFNSDRTGDMNAWLYSLDDQSTRQLTRGPGGDFQPTWSPDGSRVAFFSSRSGHLNVWTVDVESGRLSQLTRNRSIDVNPFFSPNGQLIAYCSDKGGGLEVWVMTADGRDARPLTQVGVMGHFLRWTRGGDAIVFRCPSPAPRSLEVPVDGGEPRLLPEIAGGAHMSFSPDFSRIIDVVGHKTLWVSPLQNGSPEPVFEFDDPDARIDYPVWAPDGRWVLFDRFRPQGGDIWLMENLE
ncbi:MAG TPA: protein kinase [Thermoanaerobaculia bacterium]|nr:protein kinase [Thermoanaerobaculia bacterium]